MSKQEATMTDVCDRRHMHGTETADQFTNAFSEGGMDILLLSTHMAEVDGIVIQALRRLGCDVGEDVISIRQFTAEVLVQAVSSCIRNISPDTPVPNRLSASMATKYRQASAIADACKAVGYTGDLGYEAFLYGGESDMRKLLVFLIDKIPKEEQVSAGVVPYGSVFVREMRDVIGAEFERPWLPLAYWPWKSSRPNSMNAFPSVFRSQRLTVPLTKDDSVKLNLLSDQTSTAINLVTSIVEFNSLKLACSGQRVVSDKGDFGHQEQARIDRFRQNLSSSLKSQNFADDRVGEKPSVSEKPALRIKPALPPRRNKEQTSDEIGPVADSANGVEIQLSEEEQVASLKSQLEEASENLKRLSEEVDVVNSAVQKADRAIKEGKDFLDSFEKTVKIRKHVSLASADGNISAAKLQEEVEDLQSSLEDLHDQWRAKKGALLTDLNQLRQQSRSNENSTERLKEEIGESKKNISILHAELSDRDDLVELLRKEHQRLTNNVTRTSYTKRILEILSNIKKQRLEIEKIIKDTRIVQKEINHLSGRLDRAFTETDELMFRDAKNDEFVRKAYKNVAIFHESCGGLIEAVEATGVILRETKDLEDEVDTETKKSKEQNLQRIQDDLTAIKAENVSLSARLA